MVTWSDISEYLLQGQNAAKLKVKKEKDMALPALRQDNVTFERRNSHSYVIKSHLCMFHQLLMLVSLRKRLCK